MLFLDFLCGMYESYRSTVSSVRVTSVQRIGNRHVVVVVREGVKYACTPPPWLVGIRVILIHRWSESVSM